MNTVTIVMMKLPISLSRYILLLFAGAFIYLKSSGQCYDEKKIAEYIEKTEIDTTLTATQKLNTFYKLKRNSDSCKSNNDSVYVSLLENICKYELQMKNYNTTLSYALLSLHLNDYKSAQFSKILLVKNYSLLAHYYDEVLLLNNALKYYDSTIAAAKNIPLMVGLLLDARLYKAYIYFRAGDFQKGVEESTRGLEISLNNRDTVSYLRLLNQRAQSLFYQDKLQQANNDVTAAIELSEKLHQPFQLATAYKIKALIAAKTRDFLLAEVLFANGIKERLLTKRYAVVASDYNDFGNFYRDSIHVYSKAKDCYSKAIEYASKEMDSAYLGMININLTRTFFYEHDYKTAERYYLKQMQFLKLPTDNFLINPTAKAISLIGNKHIIIALLQDKTELLLNEYKKNGLKEYLSATIETARLTDSVITQTQHEQIGEQSKLFWRNKTRAFYSNSIEACYIANDPVLAFFFFEKSRAVLLNDQLHKLDAISRLPAAEAETQEKFQIDVIEQEQKLSLLQQSSAEYAAQQIKLLQAKENFENYIKSLEQKYPAYYQYKYADDVPSLKDLQQYLAKNNQSFIHYFLGDTITYIMAITANNTRLIRLSQKEFNKEQLTDFLQLCADKQALNNHYDSFARLSNSIYRSIFQSLQLSKGRIVICSDNIVIPFDALCTDTKGKRFLLNDYSFSYVYAARFLMKQFNNPAAKGNFAGFAPVSFEKYLGVVDLKNAADALHASASYYKSDKLFTDQNASRSNFFKYASSYSIVSIFSHARADTTDNEPVLFMQDSVIHLSDLQLLNDPATKLVLLSACQTNVGKAATGEGIYSLARGFATAGIPSVAATLWKADEETIYSISEKFNEYLSGGMNKDEALQKAKLYFIQNNNSGKMLPYYWANMIIIGNTEAIKLTTTNNNHWWWSAGAAIIILIILFIYTRLRHSGNKV